MYNDILSLIFGNFENAQYFKKYYGNTRNYQLMLRDWLKTNEQEKQILKENMSAHEIT